MLALSFCRRYPLYVSALLPLVVAGCASMGAVVPHQFASDRSREYPVGIVAATFLPPVEIPLRLRGRGGGALAGAGEGVLVCGDAVLGVADGGGHPAIAGMATLFCVTVAALVGGVAGAVTAEPADAAAGARVRVEQHAVRLDPQHTLADVAADYLQGFSGVVPVPVAATGPATIDDLPVYPATGGAVGSLLELRILAFEFSGTGQKDEPLCLHFTTRARKINVATGQTLDDMQARQSVGCFALTEWLAQDEARIVQALAAAYRRASEEIIDEFYLVFHPPPAGHSVAAAAVPGYVLAPLSPPPPEVYLDIRLFPKTGDLQGFGGMHFHDLDTLSPWLTWEPLARITELAVEDASAFSETTYELRMFRGGPVVVAVAPVELIHEVRGLTNTEYRFPDELEPCSWYFWTVRARFRLHGTWRTTEWAGAYHTAGGHYSPSSSRRNVGFTTGFAWPAHYLYLPLRTPASDPQADCWVS